MIKLKKVKNGYILYNSSGGYERHSHFKNKKAACRCKALINNGVLPNQPYFIESARRLLSPKEFERLRFKNKKEKYININKGVRT